MVRKLVSPAATNDTENRTIGSKSEIWDGRDDGSSIVEDSPYTYHIDDIAHNQTIYVPALLPNPIYDVVSVPSNNPPTSDTLYLTDSGLRIMRSKNGGFWTPLVSSVGAATGIAISNDGKYVYVISNTQKKIYYSNNYGDGTWNSYDVPWKGAASSPWDIACSSNGQVIYVIDPGKLKVYKSTDYGATWNSGSPIAGSYPQGIAVDPNDSNHILVADRGGAARKVFESFDGGLNFNTLLSSIDAYQVSIDSNGYYWVSEIFYQASPAINRCRVWQYDSNNATLIKVAPDNGTGAYTDFYKFNCSPASDKMFGIYATSHSGAQYLYVADYANKAIKKYLYDNYVSSYIIVNAAHDSTPPAAINDLVTGNVSDNSVDLEWTAPGDDGNTPGTKAKIYDVRYSKSTITNDTEFSSATQATGEPYPPSMQGTTDNFTLTGLPESNTTYYFAMKSLDDVLNTSGLSNTPVIGKTGILSDWNMVSCPKQPSPNDSNSVFGDDAGLDWMWYWNSTWTGSGDPDSAGYWGRATTIIPGKGIFLLSLTNDPTGASGTDITDASYTILLKAGWNVIGNPYGTNVNLSNCHVIYNSTEKSYLDAVTAGWMGNAVYIWNGSTYVDYPWGSAKLEPWKGYWIMSYHAQDLIIYKP